MYVFDLEQITAIGYTLKMCIRLHRKGKKMLDWQVTFVEIVVGC